MKYQKIIKLSEQDLTWSFSNENPYFNIPRLFGSYSGTVRVNPFPCASHNITLLSKTVKEVESKFKIGSPVRWFVMPFECESHTNATAYNEGIYGDKYKKEKEKYLLESYVVLSGKRTMIHPSMTKYLVGHEYGHMVDYWITAKMNQNLEDKNDQIFRQEYAQIREVPYNTGYGGGKWIDNIGEIIADDFRIIVAGIDKDFYVHSCTHPLKHKKIQNYWKQLKSKYSLK